MKRLTCITAAAMVFFIIGCGNHASEDAQKVKVSRGNFKQTVQANGIITPLNKVSILPPVAGRIDKILVDEGTHVKKGQIIAWMSSSDRAALLDMALAKGKDELSYWEKAFQPTPIVAPTDGLIIARNVVEGQTVAGDTDLYDLSDKLIVEAYVDETDLANIKMDQKAEVTVDSYPDKLFLADVSLITHQAVKVNNVVSYYVDLIPRQEPGVLRAGMTANINFIIKEADNSLLIPSWAVKGGENTTVFLRVQNDLAKKPEKREVKLGDSDGSQVVVLSGLNENDSVQVESLKVKGAASLGMFQFGRPQSRTTPSAGSQSGNRQRPQ